MDADGLQKVIWRIVSTVRGEVPIADVSMVIGTALAVEHAEVHGLDVPDTILEPTQAAPGGKADHLLAVVRQELSLAEWDDQDRLALWRTYI